MPPVLRGLLFALGSMFAAVDLSAQSESLPPILVAREAAPAKALAPVASSLTSDYLQKIITHQVLAHAKVFDSPAPAATPASPGSTSGDAPVMMERFLVTENDVRLAERPKTVSPLRNLVWNGVLYSKVGPNVDTTIFLSFVPVAATGYGPARETTRAQLSFSFRF